MSLKQWMVFAILATALSSTQVAAAEVTGLPDFTRIVASEGRAVVNISTTRIQRAANNSIPEELASDPFVEFFRRYAPPQLRERQIGSLGSGFIISADGYILTNAHVVARADVIRVTLTDKREFKAQLIGSDERTDVALLKIQGSQLPVARLGPSARLQVGEWVLAIGSPFGLDNSVSAGIVSALGRQLPDESYVPYIQTDAAVNPGNSGGPLFNLSGEVVGINSQIYSQAGGFMGISFAIPIDVALDVSNQLKASGKVRRGRIGVSLQPLTQDLAQSFGLEQAQGVLINGVDANAPARRAGLLAGDVVTAVNGQSVTGPVDLQRLVGLARPGTRFVLRVWRAGSSRDISVVSEESVASAAVASDNDRPAKPSVVSGKFNQAGLVVEEVSAAQRTSLGIRYGLLVRSVSAERARAGMQVGDVIVGIAGEPLQSLKQFEEALRVSKSVLALQVVRDGVTLFVPLSVGSSE